MNFLADVVGAGFKGALIKFFRLLFFAIIILIVVYIVGLFTSTKASALVRKSEQLWNPDLTKTYSTSLTTSGNQKWAPFTFNSNWTNNTNYDLIGFKFNKLTYTIMYNYSNIIIDGEMTTGQPGYTNQIDLQITNTQIYSLYGESLTFTGILFDKDGNGTQCWRSAEFADTFLCPLIPNTIYKSFEVIINYQVPNDYTLSLSMVLERTRFFYNYDSTEIINSNGEIVQQQQQTNQTITDSNTTTSENNSTNALSDLQTTMETKVKGTNELTQMVLAPLNILSSIVSSNYQCEPLTWNIPLVNYQATIPCLSTVYNNFFSGILTLFTTVITGVYCYRTVLKLVNTIKDVLDAENDKLEVLDL